MNIWDYWPKKWPTYYRNTRAMGAALAMLVAILSMLSLRCNPMVGRESAVGLVLEVEAEGLHPYGGGEPMARILLAVADSAEIRIFLPPPVPLPGDFIPLTVEFYKKGDSMYYLDQEKWRIEGPQ